MKTIGTILFVIVCTLMAFDLSHAQEPIPTPAPITIDPITITPVEIPNITLQDVSTRVLDMGLTEGAIIPHTLGIGDYTITFMVHYYTFSLWFMDLNIANILIGAIGARLIWLLIAS